MILRRFYDGLWDGFPMRGSGWSVQCCFSTIGPFTADEGSLDPPYGIVGLRSLT